MPCGSTCKFLQVTVVFGSSAARLCDFDSSELHFFGGVFFFELRALPYISCTEVVVAQAHQVSSGDEDGIARLCCREHCRSCSCKTCRTTCKKEEKKEKKGNQSPAAGLKVHRSPAAGLKVRAVRGVQKLHLPMMKSKMKGKNCRQWTKKDSLH